MTTNSEKIDVRTVAHLARLELTEAEVEEFQADITAILEYAEQISLLDLDGVEPTARAFEAENIFRTDVVTQGIEREKALANAPAVLDKKLFEVPLVVDEEEA